MREYTSIQKRRNNRTPRPTRTHMQTRTTKALERNDHFYILSLVVLSFSLAYSSHRVSPLRVIGAFHHHLLICKCFKLRKGNQRETISPFNIFLFVFFLHVLLIRPDHRRLYLSSILVSATTTRLEISARLKNNESMGKISRSEMSSKETGQFSCFVQFPIRPKISNKSSRVRNVAAQTKDDYKTATI